MCQNNASGVGYHHRQGNVSCNFSPAGKKFLKQCLNTWTLHPSFLVVVESLHQTVARGKTGKGDNVIVDPRKDFGCRNSRHWRHSSVANHVQGRQVAVYERVLLIGLHGDGHHPEQDVASS